MSSAARVIKKEQTPKGACSYIQPPDFLKKKIVKGQGMDAAVLEQRASDALAALQEEYVGQARDDLKQIEALLDQARDASAEERAALMATIHRVAHDLRGQAGTFGYDLVTIIGTSLCNYIDDADEVQAAQFKAVEIHVDAMKAVIAGQIQGDGGATGKALLSGMQAMVAKTLHKKD